MTGEAAKGAPSPRLPDRGYRDPGRVAARAAERRAQPAARSESGQPQNRPQEQRSPSPDSHAFPFFADMATVVPVDTFKRQHQVEIKEAKRLLEKAKEHIPANPGESGFDYDLRVASEVAKRLRFEGDFRQKGDAIYEEVDKSRFRGRKDVLLMAVEVEEIDLLTTENERLRHELGDDRLKMRTLVLHDAARATAAGDLEHYFTAKTGDALPGAKEMPKVNLYAFTLFADRMLDVVDPTVQGPTRTPQSYRTLMAGLETQLVSSDPATRTLAARALTDLRERFYKRAVDAIASVDQPGLSHTPASDEARVMMELRQKVREARAMPLDQLIDGYKGVRKRLSDKHKERMRKELAGRNLGDPALKGGDFMIRRISYTPPYHEVPQGVKTKKDVEGPSLQDVAEGKDPTTGTPEPTVPPVESPTGPGPKEPGGPDQPGPLEPGSGKVTAPDAPDAPKPAPGQYTERPYAPEPFPYTEQPYGQESVPPKPLPPAPEQAEPTKVPLNLHLVAGAAGLEDANSQDVLQKAKHKREHDLQQMPLSGYARLPIFGKVLFGLRHPIKLIWQNSIARSVFEQQDIRFVSDVKALVKGTADQSVPVNLTDELIDKVEEQGRRIRNQLPGIGGWFRRRVLWGVSDFVKGITGLSQRSEQILGKRWLAEQLALQSDQRDASLQKITQRTLKEQNFMGVRYALKDQSALDRAGIETRYDIEDPQKRKEVSDRLKQLIKDYKTQNLSDEEFISRVNAYFLGDFRQSVDPQQFAEFAQREVASNMLSLAYQITGKDEDGNVIEPNRFQRYQEEKVKDGKTAWEALEINLKFGKGEWNAVRGKERMGLFSEMLARRLANRESVRGAAVMGGGVALAKDVISNAAAFLGGWAMAGALGSTTTLASSAGGLAGIAGLRFVQEVGLDGRRWLGDWAHWEGRYEKELKQASRDAARRHGSPPDARIRKELEDLLVKRASAEEMAARIRQARPLASDADADALLMQIAELDARRRITDYHGQREVGYRQHNLLEFTEGKENEELAKVISASVDAKTKLIVYKETHRGYRAGQELFSPPGVGYGQANSGLFEQYSLLAEAQFQTSSQADRIRIWFNQNTGLPAADIDNVVNNLFRPPAANTKLPAPDASYLGITDRDSMQGIEERFQRKRLHRGVSTLWNTAITGTVAPVLYYGAPMAAISEGAELVRDWDLGKYAQDWNLVLHGQIPVETVNGHPQTDLTFLQQAVLRANARMELASFDIPLRADLASPLPEQFQEAVGGRGVIDLGTLHHERAINAYNVDGVYVNAPEGIEFGQLTGRGDFVINTGTGELYDMAGLHFEERNGDLLVVEDGVNGKAVEASAMFGKDIAVADGPVRGITRTEELLRPGDLHLDKATGIQVPDGAHFQQDGVTGKWDLIADKNNQILIDNASIKDGQLDLQGAKINPSLDIDKTVHPPTEVITPSGTHPDTTTGFKTTIPDGTQWQQDGAKWDLVVSKDPSIKLIDNARFDENGQMAWDFRNPHLDVEHEPGQEVIHGPKAAEAWEAKGSPVDHRQWYDNNTVAFDRTELQGHTLKQGDTMILSLYNRPYDVAFSDNATPTEAHITQLAQQGKLGFAFSNPLDPQHPLWVPATADGVADAQLRLDPSDNVHRVTFHDGSSMTLGEFSKMVVNQQLLAQQPDGDIATEYNWKPEMFKLGLNGQMGFVEMGVMEGDVLRPIATLHGGGEVEYFIKTDGNPILRLEDPITKPGMTTYAINLTDKITCEVIDKVPTFTLTPTTPDIEWFVLPLTPRQNIEKGGLPPGAGEQSPKPTTPNDTGQPGGPQPAPRTPGEKEKLQSEQRGLEQEKKALEEKQVAGAKLSEEEETNLADINRRLAEITASIATTENLKAIVKDLEDSLEGKARGHEDGIIRTVRFALGRRHWQQVEVVRRIQQSSDDAWRGYAMVEPGDIPQAVEILLEKSKARAAQNKGTMFKWLVGDGQGLYDYSNLEVTSPRIAIYAYSQEEVLEILRSLAEDQRWQALEANRVAVSDRRRPGTNALNHNGKEWRSLSYGEQQGYSEDVAADPLWRFQRRAGFSMRNVTAQEQKQEIQEAERRLRQAYGADPQVILQTWKIFRDKKQEIAKRPGAKYPTIDDFTPADIDDVLAKMESDALIKAQQAGLENIFYGGVYRSTLNEFFWDLMRVDAFGEK